MSPHPSQPANLVVSRGTVPHLAPSPVRPISESREHCAVARNRTVSGSPDLLMVGARDHAPTQTWVLLGVDAGVDSN